MKKRISAIIVFVILIATLLTGCNEPELYHSTDENVHLFVAKKRVDYLNYLEKFDDSKFEIINMTPDESHSKYMITFRNKTEE